MSAPRDEYLPEAIREKLIHDPRVAEQDLRVRVQEHRVMLGDTVAPCHQPKIPPELWPRIRAAYPAQTMRQLADDWGVSQETIRKIVRS